MKVRDLIKWLERTNPEAEVVFRIPENEHTHHSSFIGINPSVSLVYVGLNGDVHEAKCAEASNSVAVVVN